MLHIYHFKLKTSKICLSSTKVLHGKMNLNLWGSLFTWLFGTPQHLLLSPKVICEPRPLALQPKLQWTFGPGSCCCTGLGLVKWVVFQNKQGQLVGHRPRPVPGQPIPSGSSQAINIVAKSADYKCLFQVFHAPNRVSRTNWLNASSYTT